jgi:hypothetical protein
MDDDKIKKCLKEAARDLPDPTDPDYLVKAMKMACKEMCDVDVGEGEKPICKDRLCYLYQCGMRELAERSIRGAGGTGDAVHPNPDPPSKETP